MSTPTDTKPDSEYPVTYWVTGYLAEYLAEYFPGTGSVPDIRISQQPANRISSTTLVIVHLLLRSYIIGISIYKILTVPLYKMFCVVTGDNTEWNQIFIQQKQYVFIEGRFNTL